MTQTTSQIVAVTRGPAIHELLAGQQAHAQVQTITDVSALRARLTDRTDVLVIDCEQPGLSPFAALRMAAAAPARPPIVLLGTHRRLQHRIQQFAARLHPDAVVHAPKFADAATAIDGALQARRSASPGAADLRRAIDEHDLTLYYQPKFDCADERTVVGVEALIRWNHPELGVLSPGCILPLARATNLLTEVTDFTITEAIRQHAAWRDQGLDLPVAVNLAPGLIRDARFPERLLNSLRQFDVPPSRLTLELKETESVSDRELCLDALKRLRHAGLGLTLDDYGAGLSSITELYKLPFTEVKIDRELVADAAHNTQARLVLRSIARLAHELSIDVTAEGVETRSDLTAALAAGCDWVQGKLLCEPTLPFCVAQLLRGDGARLECKRPLHRAAEWQLAAG
jgi:EAL domain-containing protein (putative c-di-GMP-specific phosphodiesterase class I)